MDVQTETQIEATPILTKSDSGAYYITLNRPTEGNVLTDAMVKELAHHIRSAPSDAKVIVLRGAGPDFCLGRDIPALKREGQPKEALALRQRNETIFDAYSSFRSSPIPVVTVVQGRAYGFGCALAALGDITLATEESSFSLPEMHHGIMPSMAMSALFDRISKKNLLYLTYSAEKLNGHQAAALGIVNVLVAEAGLDLRLSELIASIQRASLAAIRGVKEFSRATAGMDVNAASEFARNLHATINSSPELTL
ncbi:enoyl-CoA hydratase/isomerase family protein [Paraburkholderia sp. LEh10]|uniref:enoyl-CoA hydratase/isomerase family protein n=1 Tax=Paraburkholderia sp. LEh10 TaxID=2821353 RepID=UPI001AE4F7B0|nr:enoyl-CoA hydratase/isomerase family protein [Paraburkholderia sp. LEh10]MBP0590398.1 enoyl-CoA hydratase/isomerase family protein [Paraburkholderia sp. LEh10]